MGLEDDFKAAADEAKTLPSGVSNEDQLSLYALFKQANLGDNTTTRPGFLDLKGKAKWDAWTGNKGMEKEAAMNKYIETVASLKAKYA